MSDKSRRTSKQVDEEGAAAEQPQYAPHQDDSFDFNPGTNPMGVARGPAHPFANPPAYTGQGAAAEMPAASIVGDYSRGDVQVASTADEHAARGDGKAQAPAVSGTGVAASGRESSAAPVSATPSPSNTSTPGTATTNP